MLTDQWTKSSRSAANEKCLEARFRKATASGAAGDCVEVAFIDGTVEVRDSKDPDGPVLRFSPAEWSAALDGAKRGEFDLPAVS